jgi:dTDP-4-dehydrorhamnose reductase
MKSLLAVGLGYSAREIAARLAHGMPPPPALRAALSHVGCGLGPDNKASPPSPLAGEGSRQRRVGAGENRWRIIGTGRGAESLEAILALGYEGLPFAGDTPSVELARAIGEATHLLVSAAPDEAGDPLLKQHRADLEAAPKLQWIGYLSTIGVYGDTGGAWVDETATPQPVSQRSKWRLAAEQDWQDFAARHGVPLQIFRLAGIYGPGRNALERMRAGQERTIYKPGQVFNRIHVEDIATTVLAGIDAGARATGVFNVTDDEPAAPQDVAAFCAELLGIEPPPVVPFEEADLTPMARSFYEETKRVRTERITQELGVWLAYPTYREGLGALAEGL